LVYLSPIGVAAVHSRQTINETKTIKASNHGVKTGLKAGKYEFYLTTVTPVDVRRRRVLSGRASTYSAKVSASINPVSYR
jgi:hypothetical protein